MTQKYVKLNTTTGGFDEVALLDTSSGAGDAGKGIALDSAGKLALNMMPTGVGPELTSIVSSENLVAGDFVNVWNNAGTANVRKADATDNTKRAHGFVITGVTSPAAVDVYFDGANEQLSGLTAGARMFLSAATPGAATTTPPASTGNLLQYLGSALNATTVAFRPTDGTTVA